MTKLQRNSNKARDTRTNGRKSQAAFRLRNKKVSKNSLYSPDYLSFLADQKELRAEYRRFDKEILFEERHDKLMMKKLFTRIKKSNISPKRPVLIELSHDFEYYDPFSVNIDVKTGLK